MPQLIHVKDARERMYATKSDGAPSVPIPGITVALPRAESRTYGTSLVRCWLAAMAFVEGLWWRTLHMKVISAIYCAGLDDCSGIEMVGAGGTQQHFHLSGQSINWAALIFGGHRSRFKPHRFRSMSLASSLTSSYCPYEAYRVSVPRCDARGACSCT